MTASGELRIGPEDVDVEDRGTFDLSSRGRALDNWEPVRVEPAWFVPREKSLARLSRRLLSESSPTSGKDNKSLTFRLAAILDWKTEKVHLVSVGLSNRETRVTRFCEEMGSQNSRYRSIPLERVFAVKLADGRRRYEVIGCARTRVATEYYQWTFGDRREFRELFAKPVMELQRAVQSGARVTQIRMEAFGVEAGASCQALPGEDTGCSQDDGCLDCESIEPDCQEEQCDDTPSWPMTEAYTGPRAKEQGRLALTVQEVELLEEWMPSFTTVDELADLLTARHPDGRLVIGDALYEVIERIAGTDVTFFTMAEEIGIGQALEAYGY